MSFKKAIIGSIQVLGLLLVVLVTTAHWWSFSLIQLLPLLTAPLAIGAFFGAFFWRKRNRWYFYSHLVMIGLLAWALPRHVQWNSQEATTEHDIAVLTYNVGQFQHGSSEAVAQQINSLNADVVCLQEFGFPTAWPHMDEALEAFAQQAGYPHFALIRWEHDIFGMATLSKWPLLAVDTVFVEQHNTNGVSYVSIDGPSSPFGVVNAHLASFNFEHELKGHNRFIDNTLKRINLLNERIPKQASQMASIQSFLSQREGPSVVVGDLNALPGSRVVHLLESTHTDAFRQAGQGLGTTHHHTAIPLRIDYQFTPQTWEALQYQVIPSTLSDHEPLLVTFRANR